MVYIYANGSLDDKYVAGHGKRALRANRMCGGLIWMLGSDIT